MDRLVGFFGGVGLPAGGWLPGAGIGLPGCFGSPGLSVVGVAGGRLVLLGGVMSDSGGSGLGLWAAADLATPMAIRVAATLRVADHIATGRVSVDSLASVVGADRDALGRVLAHLVGVGVLSSSSPGVFGLTALGEQLRSDHPGGVRDWLDLDGAVGYADLCLIHLLHTVRTGQPAFPRQFGVSFWDDLSADAARSASFDALMGGRLVAAAPDVAAAYPWGDLGSVVDVGGGSGSLLIAILLAHSGLRGTVVDLAGPVGRASAALADAGLAGRGSVVAGSFFDPLPGGAGGYILSGVLHDWDDADALRILTRCAEAASGSGKVLLVDHVEPAQGASDTAMDLRMLSYFCGRERSFDELRELAGRAGLSVTSVLPAGSRSVVELSASA